MTSSAETPAEVLQRVRTRVQAETPGAPQEVRAKVSLRPLPPEIEAKTSARQPDDQSRQAVVKIAAVAAVIGAVGLVVLVLGVVTGDVGLIVIGAGETLIFGGGGIALYRYAQLDPLRLTPAQARQLEDSRRWTPPAGSDDALLATATIAAQRIVDSPAWHTGVLADAGVLIPLGPALDAIALADDTQLTRVAALTAYADSVETLRGGAAELDAGRVEVLAFLLSSAIHDAR